MQDKSVELVASKLQQAFEYLADKAGVAADHFWPIFVKQQMVEGALWIGGTIVIVAVTAAAVRVAIKEMTSRAYSEAAAFRGGISISIGVVGVILSVIFIVGVFSTATGKLINPEYYAIQAVASMAK